MANDTSDPHKTCFQSNGTKETEIAIQAVLPDLTHFTVIHVNLEPVYNFPKIVSSSDV